MREILKPAGDAVVLEPEERGRAVLEGAEALAGVARASTAKARPVLTRELFCAPGARYLGCAR